MRTSRTARAAEKSGARVGVGGGACVAVGVGARVAVGVGVGEGVVGGPDTDADGADSTVVGPAPGDEEVEVHPLTATAAATAARLEPRMPRT
jgi:hypothetical protein